MNMHVDSPIPALPPVGAPRKRSGGHIAAIVVGSLALLPGFGMLLGGTALAVGHAVATDDDGYFATTLDRIESDGVALATNDLFDDANDNDGDAVWALDFFDVDLRLRVDGAATSDRVFVGIARTADVERYLDGTRHTLVVDVDDHRPVYEQVTGGESMRSLPAPGDQTFWAASASGAGSQELDWAARGGSWSVVVMNADASPGVAADVEVGARSGAITPIAVTLLVVGAVVTLGGIALIVVGARGRRSPGSPSDDARLAGSPLPPPVPEHGAALDDADTHPAAVG